MIRRIQLLTAVTSLLLTAGCGIDTEPQPHSVSPPPGPFAGLAAPAPTIPAPTASDTVKQTLYFVKDGKLVPVTHRVTYPGSIDEVVTALQAGPSDSELNAGLTTALGGTSVIAGITQTGDQAELALAAPIEGTGRADEALAYAQLVCSLTSRPDISSVVFTRDGQPVGVPRGDGSLTVDPLTAADYRTLLGE